MSTIQTVTQHTTALCLALFLTACSGPAPINEGTSAPSTSSEPTALTASPNTGGAPASTDATSTDDASEQPNQSEVATKENDADMPMDEQPADKLFNEQIVQWDAIDKGKRSEHDDTKGLPWGVEPGYEVVGDNQLRIYFQGGSRTCFGYRIEAVETEKTVEIKLVQGFLKIGEDQVCTAEATHRTMLVDLKQPLGERKVVSAAPANDN